MSSKDDAEIHLKVTGEREAARALEKVGDAAEDAGTSLEGMGESSTEASKQTEKTKESFRATGDEAEKLDAKIKDLTATHKGLVRQFAATGDSGIEKEIRAASRELAKLQRYAKTLLPDDEEAESVGKQIGTKLLSGLTDITGMSPTGIAAIAGLAAAAAPALGATIEGAVLGGIGTGGIIGGIVLASRDQRVKAAGADLAAQFASEFGDLGAPFVAPVVEAARMLGSASGGWADKLAPSMDKLASKVVPLEQGIEGLVDEALPGLTEAFDAAGPVIDTLANELPDVGAAFGDLFSGLAEHPVAAQHAIEELLDIVEGGVSTIGNFIDGLATVYQTALEIEQGFGLADLSVQGLGGALHATTKATLEQADAAEEATNQIWDYKSAIDALFHRTLDIREANINYEQAVDDLTEGLTKGKHTLDITTQAGRDHWEVINKTAKAINDLRDANIANNMPLDQANALYEQQFEALRKTLLQLGYDKKAVDDYIASLIHIPASITTAFTAPGLDSLLAKAGRLGRTLRQYGGEDLQYGGGFQARASGGGVSPWQDYIVGENGPELLRMGASGGTVTSAPRTAAALAGQGGAATVHIQVSVRQDQRSVMAAFAEAIMPYLQIEVVNQGGDPTSVLGAPTYGG